MLTLKKLGFIKVLKDPRIIMLLWNHFNYSIRNINSWEDLTLEEKSFIDKELFQKITEHSRESFIPTPNPSLKVNVIVEH